MQKGKKNKKNTKQMDWGVQAVSKGGAVMKKKENGLLDQIRAIRLKSDSSDQIIDSGNRGLQIKIQWGWRRGCMVNHTPLHTRSEGFYLLKFPSPFSFCSPLSLSYS